MTSYRLDSKDYKFIGKYKDYKVEIVCFWVFLVLMVIMPSMYLKLLIMLSMMCMIYIKNKYKIWICGKKTDIKFEYK